MTSLWFFRFSLALPLVTPLPFSYIAYTTERGVLSPTLNNIAGFFAGSLVFGGVPYAAFAVYGLWWLRNRSREEALRRMAVSPLLFCGWLALAWCAYAGVMALWHLDASGLALASYAIILLPFALASGYFYVLVVYLIYQAFRRLTLIADETTVA